MLAANMPPADRSCEGCTPKAYFPKSVSSDQDPTNIPTKTATIRQCEQKTTSQGLFLTLSTLKYAPPETRWDATL